MIEGLIGMIVVGYIAVKLMGWLMPVSRPERLQPHDWDKMGTL